MTHGVDFISRSPQPIPMKIFLNLHFQEVCCITKVCKRWHQLANEEFLWKSFAESYECVPPKGQDYKLSILKFAPREILCEVSSEDELLEKITAFFNKYPKCIIARENAYKTRLRAVSLRYRPTKYDAPYLFATICRNEDYNGQYDHKELFDKSAIKITITSKYKTDIETIDLCACLRKYKTAVPGKNGLFGYELFGWRITKESYRYIINKQMDNEFIGMVKKILMNAY